MGDIQNDEKLRESEEKDLYVFDNELQDFIQGDATDNEYACLLYRYNDTEGEGKRRVQINKYYNEVPDSHHVGIQFGSGRYLLCVSGTDKLGKKFFRSFNLKLGKNYDDLMNANKKSVPGVNAAAVPVPVNGSGNGGVDVMQIMNFCLTMVEKISGTINKGSQAPQMPEQVLNSMYNHMQKLMFTQARDTQRMLTELRQREDDAMQEQYEPEPQGNNDFIIKVIDLIKSVLPSILNPAMASLAVGAAKKTEAYKRIKESPELQKEVIDGLKKEVGEKNTAAIVEQFNLGSSQKGKKR